MVSAFVADHFERLPTFDQIGIAPDLRRSSAVVFFFAFLILLVTAYLTSQPMIFSLRFDPLQSCIPILMWTTLRLRQQRRCGASILVSVVALCILMEHPTGWPVGHLTKHPPSGGGYYLHANFAPNSNATILATKNCDVMSGIPEKVPDFIDAPATGRLPRFLTAKHVEYLVFVSK